MGIKIFISLGTGKNQLPLIQAARKQRFKIIGIDQDPVSPGMRFCDYKIIESVLNYRKVLYKISTLWYEGEIEGGYCASYGKALLSWSYLAEKFRLPGTPRPLSEALLDKYEVRKRLQAVSDQTSLFKQPQFLAASPAFKAKTTLALDFPLIVKPRSGWAKNNIKTVNSRVELNRILLINPVKKDEKKKPGKLLKNPKLKNKKKPAIIKQSLNLIMEEKIDGDEITVSGLIQDFKFLLLSISDKLTTNSDPFIELEHQFPSKYYHLEENIINIHQKITETLQITDTPVVSEWKIRDNELYLIEMSLQIPGEFIGSFIIPEAVRYDFFANLVRLTSGKPISRKIKKRRFRKGVVKFYPAKLDPEEEKKICRQARSFWVLNENPLDPPKSNHDRYAAAGFIN